MSDPAASEPAAEQERLFEFLYACPVGLVEFDACGAISVMNPYAMKHLLPLVGRRDPGNLFSILESCAPELRNLFADFPQDRGMVCDGHRIVVDLGSGRHGRDPKVLACTLAKLDHDRAIATITDVTEQVSQERRLRQAETWFASLLDGSTDFAVLSVTPDGTIEAVNASFPRQTGFAAADAIGEPLHAILFSGLPSGASSVADQLRWAARDGWHLEEGWQKRQDGERQWCQRLIAARTQHGASDIELVGFSVVLRSVVRQEAGAGDLRRLLTCDHLTGAANRAHFFKVMTREHQHWRDERRSLALLMIDIDRFKSINDRYGHPAGDRVLRQFSDTCQAVLRPTDLFARLGGEEFAALLPDTSLPAALAIAERLRAAVAAMRVEGPTGAILVTSSFGCAMAGDAGDSVDALIAAADTALYAAKLAGRDRVCTSDPVRDAIPVAVAA